ncbi:MAG: hypothetical protein AAGA73_16860 [Pseudomonadota bacterium]
MKSTSILTATFLSSLVLHGASAAEGMDELDGTWVSMSCELRPQAGADGIQPWYLKRSIVFDGDRIDAHFVTYVDPHCATPLLELKFGGHVTVTGPSAVIDGARDVDLVVNDYLTVKPRMAGFTDFLNSADNGTCGAEVWEVGTEQDVFPTGCSVMGIAPQTPMREYEVLHIAAGKLYFGARPVDGSSLNEPESRPTALQMPLLLKEGGQTQRVGVDDLRPPEVVEIVMFEQQPDANPEDVRAFFENITMKMNQNDSLLYRTVAQGQGGTWLCVNYWSSREAMETLNGQAQHWADEFAAMGLLAIPDSFRLTSYDIARHK